ncbi:amidohydrolase family protein, partial [Candidatus Woesearchaeota archaeon]|nr:amidohydrolase family protein [Candidatus Woesearchaeota archaeon]
HLDTLLRENFKGVKLHPRSQQIDLYEDHDWVYEMISERGIPLLFHCNGMEEISSPRPMVELAKRYSNLNIVIAHFCGLDNKAFEYAKPLDNVYVDTSLYSRTLKIKDLVKSGFDRLIYASDAPFDSPRASLVKVYESDLNPEDKEKILYGNAAKLLGLD